MYLIVIFDIEASIEGVPLAWVKAIDSKKYCYWPTKISGSKIANLIRQNQPANSEWMLHQCRIKERCSSYKQMLTRLEEHRNPTTTDMACSSDEETFAKANLCKSDLYKLQNHEIHDLSELASISYVMSI